MAGLFLPVGTRLGESPCMNYLDPVARAALKIASLVLHRFGTEQAGTDPPAVIIEKALVVSPVHLGKGSGKC